MSAPIHRPPPSAAADSRWVLGSILTIAAALRLYRLGSRSLWFDEVAQAAVAAETSLRAILAGVEAHHGAAPLDYLITSVMVRLSHSEWVLRLPPALWGTLSVYWLARLGRRLVSAETGIIAALLLTFSSFHIWYSQELRFYASFVLLTLIATECFLVASERNRTGLWMRYSLCLVAGLYTHYYTVLLAAFHGVYALGQSLSRSRARTPAYQRFLRFTIAALVGGVGFVPWVLFAVRYEVGNRPAIEPPPFTWELVRETLTTLSGGNPKYWPLWFAFALIGLGICTRRDSALGLMLALWVGATLPLVVLSDQLVHYFFNVRQVLFILPPYLLLVAAGVEATARAAVAVVERLSPRRDLPVATLASACLTLGLLATAIPQLPAYYRSPREDWRGAGEYLEKTIRPGDVVVLLNGGPYIKFYAPTAVRQEWRFFALKDLDAAVATRWPVRVLWTHYAYLFPEGAAIHEWIENHAAQRVDFGMQMAVYELRQPD